MHHVGIQATGHEPPVPVIAERWHCGFNMLITAEHVYGGFKGALREAVKVSKRTGRVAFVTLTTGRIVATVKPS